MRHHQGNTNAPAALAPLPTSLRHCLASFPFGCKRAENYGNRCVATCQAACDMVHTRLTLCAQHHLAHSPANPRSPPAAHTLCGYLCLSLSMLGSARGSLHKVAESGERIFMLWPMFVLFELYVAFSVPPPHLSGSQPAPIPARYTSFRFDGHTAAFTASFSHFFPPFSSIFSQI